MFNIYLVHLEYSLPNDIREALEQRHPQAEVMVRSWLDWEAKQILDHKMNPFILAENPGKAAEIFATQEKLTGMFRCIIMGNADKISHNRPLYSVLVEPITIWKATTAPTPLILC